MEDYEYKFISDLIFFLTILIAVKMILKYKKDTTEQ